MRLELEDIISELSSRLEKEKSIKKKMLLKQAIETIKQLQ